MIYAIEQHSVFGDRVIAAIDAETQEDFAISPLVKLECLVKPLENGNSALKQYYEAAFNTLVSLPVTDKVFLEAATLRASFKLKTPDALHLSCAQFHRCSALWTNDDRLASAGHGLPVNIITDT